MTTLVSGLFTRSLNLAKVAREIVAETYHSNASVAEYVEDIKDKLLHLDQVYLDAAKKVTEEKEDDIKGRLEYRLLNFGTQKLSSARDGLQKVSEKRKKIIENVDQKKQAVKADLVSKKDRFANTFSVKLRSAQETTASIRSKSVILVRETTEWIRSRASTTGKLLQGKLHSAAEAVDLRHFLESVQSQFIALNNFTQQEILLVKKNFQRLHDYLSDKIQGSDLVNAVKRGGTSAVNNFRAALSFLKETYIRNARSHKKTRQDTTEFFWNFIRKNRQLLSFMRAENKKLVSSYAKKVEVEMFYTPKDSVRVLGKVRDAVDYIAHRNDPQEVFVADDHTKTE